MASRVQSFGLVNLGCPKNVVDSEGLLGAMALAGFAFAEDPAQADVCLVNTCGFLDASRREAADVLRELAARRGRKGRPLLVATGCLVERAGGAPELADFLAAADARAGFAEYPRLPELCRNLLAGNGPVFNAGERVAILAGAGALGATDEVIEIADILGAGVAKALLGKAAVPDDLPFVTGSIGLLGTKPSWDLMTECDTLLMIGSRFPYSEFLPKEGDARGVQIDIDPAMVSIRFIAKV